VVLAVAVMAPVTRPESTGPLLTVSERVEQCADGAAASRKTAPGKQAQASQASQAQASRRLGQAAEPAGVPAARSS
jgi:hypothetical protein